MIDRKEFRNPSSQYRIKPFWFWNSRLDSTELQRQIGEMKEKGIGGFFIHARFGLETEYMSSDWFDAVRLCVKEAARLGMEVWLYDENPFPSGIADLKVSSRTEYRNRYMECREVTLTPGINTLTVGKCEVPAVCGADAQPLETIYADGVLTAVNPSGKDITAAVYILKIIDNPNGKIFGINYMNAEAVGRFIELTHEKYLEHLGCYFGTVIKGVFLDEPALLPWHQDLNWYTARKDGRVLAWDEKIFGLMKCKYEPAEILTALFYGTNDKDGSIRRHYWSTVSTLYEKNFFSQYSGWCCRHGLLLTGHVLLEEGLYFNHLFQGNIMKDLEYLDMPGTDQLCSYAEQNGMEYMVGNAGHLPVMRTNVQGQKTVSSAAHLSGKKRVLSESFGLSGWTLNPQDMKRIVDWQYSLGINQLCPHAIFYSIEGFRKYDAPPCHMHNSFWPYYRLFADYTARLSYVLSSGRHTARAAVLYPLSPFRSAYIAGRQREEDRQISDVFDMLCRELIKFHVDYDIIGEHHLEDCAIQNGILQIADESYRMLFVPSPKGLPEAAAAKVSELAAGGGRILVFNVEENTFDFDTSEGTARFLNLLERFLGSAEKDVTITGDGNREINCLRRTLADEDVYFFANTSGRGLDVRISVGSAGHAVIYDTENGCVYDLENCEQKNGRTVFDRFFGPYASLLVGIGKVSVFPALRQDLPITAKVVTLDRKWCFRRENFNVFPFENWNFNVRVSTFGSDFTYKNSFFILDKPSALKLMLDDIEYRGAFMGLSDVSLRVNGTAVPITDEYNIEKKFKLADITDMAKTGRNTVEIVIIHSPWSGEPHLITSPVKLLGDFSLIERDGEQLIAAPRDTVETGSWTLQGCPFYSGSCLYSGELYLEKRPFSALLEMTGVSDCAEVFVNGKQAGTRLWDPMSVNISPFVTEGANLIEIRVTNSMANFIHNENRPSGLTGDVKVYIEP